MVYSPAKVVACIKVNGEVLREDGNSVILPFGSEYSVLVKNLNPVRIQCKVSVDGTDATDGVWLVVQPNSSLELERFIRNGNLGAGNRFKFIERTKDIEGHRGIRADDGLVRIEYQVEKRPPVVDEVVHHHRHVHDDPWPLPPCKPWPQPWWKPDYICRGLVGDDDIVSPQMMLRSSAASAKGAPVRAMAMSAKHAADRAKTETGITVPGSESSQRFSWAGSFPTLPSEVIVLQLRGAVGGKKAVKAVTVKAKPQCRTCGKSNKGASKFCSKCGTALSPI